MIGKNQKEKCRIRARKYRKQKDQVVRRKVFQFLRPKIREFKLNNERTKTGGDPYSDYINKILKSPTCYLTGSLINLEDGSTYQLDHITPISKGGDCSCDNMGLTLRNANMSKFDMTLSEYISLCKKVVNNSRKKKY